MRNGSKISRTGIGRGFGLSAAAAIVAFSGLAFAAEPERPILGGPQVQEQARERQQARQREEMRAEGREQMAQRAQERLAVTAAMGAIRVLASDRAPEGLALSEEQAEAIRKIQAEHRAEVVAYYQEHRAEVRELLVKGGFDRAVELLDEDRLRPEGIERVIGSVLPMPQGPMGRGEGEGRGGAAGERDGARVRERMEQRREQMDRRAEAMRDMTPERREAVRGLAELRQGAPSPVGAARRSMQQLNEQQRAWVTERVEQARQRVEAARQRAEEVRERRMRQEETRERRQRRQGDGGGGAGGGGERQNRRRGGN